MKGQTKVLLVPAELRLVPVVFLLAWHPKTTDIWPKSVQKCPKMPKNSRKVAIFIDFSAIWASFGRISPQISEILLQIRELIFKLMN